MSIRVAIIEDQKETREMLAVLLNGSAGYECAGSFEDAESAIAGLGDLCPDVVLVDIHLPGQSGIECIVKLKDALPQTQFIMCTSLEDNQSIFQALKAGATGYITKSVPPARILEAITDAFNGGSPMSSQIARKVVSFFQGSEPNSKELEKLSKREQEILGYLSKGYRYKEISALLHISMDTVRKHIHHIYGKLQVNSRTDALNKLNYRH